MQKLSIILTILLIGSLLAGCAPKPEVSENGIEVSMSAVYIAASGVQAPAVAYMHIKNSAARADRLGRVSADFGDASLHETKITGDVMSMDEIDGIDFPAGALVELRSGSYHIMINNPRAGLKPGDTVRLTLEFQQAGKIIVPVEVRTY